MHTHAPCSYPNFLALTLIIHPSTMYSRTHPQFMHTSFTMHACIHQSKMHASSVHHSELVHSPQIHLSTIHVHACTPPGCQPPSTHASIVHACIHPSTGTIHAFIYHPCTIQTSTRDAFIRTCMHGPYTHPPPMYIPAPSIHSPIMYVSMHP